MTSDWCETRKKWWNLREIFITLVRVFHVYFICGKSGVTFVEKFFITLVKNFIMLVGIFTLVGKFVTFVGFIISKKLYYTCRFDTSSYLNTIFQPKICETRECVKSFFLIRYNLNHNNAHKLYYYVLFFLVNLLIYVHIQFYHSHDTEYR